MSAYLPYPDWLTPRVSPGLPVRWYGVMYVVAFVITYALFCHEARRSGLCDDRDEISRFFTWIIAGALLGGRLFFVFVFADSQPFIERPWTIFWPFDDGRFTGIQGMSYHGGFLGVIVGTIGYAVSRKQNVLEWGDVLAVSAPLGYTFGRIGNFINGELLGRISAAPWAVLFPQSRRVAVDSPFAVAIADAAGIAIAPGMPVVNLPRHASQLYEAVLEGLVLWLVLWFVFRNRRMFRGSLIALYTLGYGVARFLAEYFRQTNEEIGFVLAIGRADAHVALTDSLLHLTEGHVYSLAMTACGLIVLIICRLLHRREPVVQTFESGPASR
ncbi:MAG: prolipoprotein diacylglyceryl transferase [Spirochaetaceae bacterium]|nr:MAG: prolipoprotein diacylglyceryl transferase [Spirochaetaceae bacterium]